MSEGQIRQHRHAPAIGPMLPQRAQIATAHKAAQNYAGQTPKGTARLQLNQHSIQAISGLIDILQRQNTRLARQRFGRPA